MTDSTTGSESLLEELGHEREIRDALMRYCRGVDRKDMDLVRSAYHEDALDDHGLFSGTIDEMVQWMEERHTHILQSMHCLAQVMIQRRGSVAAVESYCVTFATLGHLAEASRRRYIPDPAEDSGEPLQVTTCVRFIDRFELREVGWKIAHRAVALETMRWEPTSPSLPPGGNWSIQAKRGSDDVSYSMFAAVNDG